jgi:PEP-CTERM motif
MSLFKCWVAFVAASLVICASSAFATPYTVSYLDGGNWQTLFAQGFNTQLGATPNPGVSVGSSVDLSKFEFFKSGTADSASNIRLAILNNLFPSSPLVTSTTTTSPTFVGLSTNTIASTAGIATGDPVAFDFANLPLVYGNDYAAVFVNVGTDVGNGAPLTPVRVSALAANYVDVGGGDFHPATNYGTETQYNYATSNFINAGYFSTFSYAGDADFRATLNPVPEPASLMLAILGLGLVTAGYRRRGKAN